MRAEKDEQDGRAAATTGAPSGSAVGKISDARLVQLFSRPRSPKQMLAGLRALGFSADAVRLMTAAKSRDVVYSWAAGRARPGMVQAQRLDEIRQALYFICRHRDLGAEAAWMLFNAKFAEMDLAGPTAMEMIAKGEIATVMDSLEKLVDGEDDGGGGPPDDDPESGPPPLSTSEKQPLESNR
jgi:hypothetical protein